MAFVAMCVLCTMGTVNQHNSEQLPLEPEADRPHETDGRPLSHWPGQAEGREGAVRPVKIWYVRNISDQPAIGDSSKIEKGSYDYNVSTGDGERPVWFVDVPGRELQYEIERLTGEEARAADFPEVVIVDIPDNGVDYSFAHKENGHLATAYLERELQPFDEVADAVEHFHKRLLYGGSAYLFHYDELIDPIEGSDFLFTLDDKVFSPVYHETYRNKNAITQETLVDSGFGRFFLDEDKEIEPTLQEVWAYMNDHDDTHLKKLITEDRLRAAYDEMCTFDEDDADDDYSAIKLLDKEQNGGFASWNEYKRYRRSLATAARKLRFEDVKAVMQKRFLELFKGGIDKIADEILNDHESLIRDQRMITPVIVSVSTDPLFQRHAVEHGANMIPAKLEEGDVERLLILSNQMKLSEASLARERTRRVKQLFYKAHEEDLSARSDLTADTKQELGILEDILGRVNAKEILDVGCGEGRIAAPLTRSGYSVTGLEANEAFRKKAAETIGSEERVLAGDIIDYRKTVPAEQYDAVTYTWHTILEAYGIGNTMQSLVSAWRALRPGGVLVFDQPTRENPGMEDGWYGDKEKRHYLAYLMTEEELRFTLRMAGFEKPEIRSWTTKPTELYPEGMKKWTVVAKKPEIKKPHE